jgi:SAM-dependent methyltransferase
MYEEHPYPRWFAIDRWPALAYGDWLEGEGVVREAGALTPEFPQILVAGCGTGQDAIWLASDIAGARVLAVDMSLASLAYAQRMARELGVTNVEFAQADILELGALPQRFDMIYSKGVLHHLEDPRAGLGVLSQLLRPGGLLKVGLYSERARAAVNAARKLIRERGMPATEASIRQVRELAFASGKDDALAPLVRFRDFYSMSMCRDMMFHVQEHQFRLPQVVALLRGLGFTVLGLADVPRHAASGYRLTFPGAPLDDYERWDDYEARHTETFAAMYQLWCQWPDAPTAA